MKRKQETKKFSIFKKKLIFTKNSILYNIILKSNILQICMQINKNYTQNQFFSAGMHVIRTV